MKAIFFNAAGHRVKALSAVQIRRRSFYKPGERGTRRYPFKVLSASVAFIRATFIGTGICCELPGGAVCRFEPNHQHAYLYHRR